MAPAGVPLGSLLAPLARLWASLGLSWCSLWLPLASPGPPNFDFLAISGPKLLQVGSSTPIWIPFGPILLHLLMFFMALPSPFFARNVKTF